MNTVTKLMYEWKTINWKQFQRNVFKLQKRIYQASKRGDARTVRNLQKLLLKSQSAKHLAVRKVAQDNQGKRTAGIDGVRALLPKQKLALAKNLALSNKAKPARRVWIPKPYTSEKRPLGIPIMADRAAQALVKLGLEPEWEARFESNSYGFRPGRSAHDAIEAIFNSIRYMPKYVLDADIEKCFDKIDHEKLLNKLNTFPTLQRTIKGWLKAGVMEDEIITATESGTPQGGVISPLLANIALHGLQGLIEGVYSGKMVNRKIIRRAEVIRYADDFLILHPDIEAIKDCQQLAQSWLAEMGLTMKASKTRICHTLMDTENEEAGFDFLGMEVRQYKVGKRGCGKNTQGQPLGFKTLIKPSKKAQKRQSETIGNLIRRQRNVPQRCLIESLNPIIVGWSNYYAPVVSKEIFNSMDHKLFTQLYSWARKRHHNKGKRWVVRKYWRLEKGRWDFGTREGCTLRLYTKTKIKRFIKVKQDKSPFDGDWSYWSTRTGRYPTLSSRTTFQMKQQKGKCSYCGLYFTSEDVLEEDHSKLKSHKHESMYSFQLLHKHCHRYKWKDVPVQTTLF